MSTSPIQADHVTYHHHEGPETTSQAVQNYAGAAFLVGAAVFAISAGVSYILCARGSKKEKSVK